MDSERESIFYPSQRQQWILFSIIIMLFLTACGGGGSGGSGPSCNSGYCLNQSGTCCPVGTDFYCPASNLCASVTDIFNGAICPSKTGQWEGPTQCF